MSKKKFQYKKKGSHVKGLDAKILKVLNQNSQQSFNYKQLAAKLDIKDAGAKQQLIRLLEELKHKKRIEETNRGKFKIIQNEHYHIGVLDFTMGKNAYFITDDLDHDAFIPAININNAKNLCSCFIISDFLY